MRFEKADSSIVVECTYDTMGRRATKKVTTNGTLTEHRRFLYRGYLQIACCDLTRAYTPALWFITWDPTQPTATRPLAIQKNGTWYSAPARLASQGSRSQVCSRLGVWLLKPHPAYGWDLTKNICETYRTDARIDIAYTYTPYGEVSPAHAYDQPLRWSSEYHDTELGLVYYNYRHYNPAMGRWMGRDMLFQVHLYKYALNSPEFRHDYLGLTERWKKVITAYNENPLSDSIVGSIVLGLHIDPLRPASNSNIHVLIKKYDIDYYPHTNIITKISKKQYSVIFSGTVHASLFDQFIYSKIAETAAGFGGGGAIAGAAIGAVSSAGLTSIPLAKIGTLAGGIVGSIVGALRGEEIHLSVEVKVQITITEYQNNWEISPIHDLTPETSGKSYRNGELYFTIE